MLANYFTSLRNISLFMVSFGLLMGILFPFYSALFFGVIAFTPLYVIGCLAAGLMVGLFSCYCIKQSLKVHLEKHMAALMRISGTSSQMIILQEGKDELQSLLSCQEELLGRVESSMATIGQLTSHIDSFCRHLAVDTQSMATANEDQLVKSQSALQAVAEVKESFTSILQDVSLVAERSEELVAASDQMHGTLDAVAKHMREHSSAVLETSASIEEVVATVRETGNNIEELSCSTEQTASSILQISTAISLVRDHAQRTAVCSEDVQQRTGEGLEAMALTLDVMHRIEQSSELSFASISRLSVHAEQVGKILAVIRDVVEQTNLLSLNASIIAAQAGERGRSFAVVAEEVRTLARHTAKSAQQIEELVRNIQAETASVHKAVSLGNEQVKEGVKVAAKTNDSLNRIGASTAEVMQMVRKIVSATVEQASGSRLISGEAEKNLERVKMVTRAVQEQKRTTGQIVLALHQIQELSQQVMVSIQEQIDGIQKQIKGITEHNQLIVKLRETAGEKSTEAANLAEFVRETENLSRGNTDRALNLSTETAALTEITASLEQEVAKFRT